MTTASTTFATFTTFARWSVLAAALLLNGATLAQTPTSTHRSTSTQSPWEVITNFKLRADPVEPAEFVKNSRPPEDSLHYIPLGRARPEPSTRILATPELAAREASLERSRAHHDAIAARAPSKVRVKSVAAYPPRLREAKKPAFECLLTCVVDKKPVREPAATTSSN